MSAPSQPNRVDVASYYALADCGLVSHDDRIELLDGAIVAMQPRSPLHAAGVYRVEQALRSAFPPGTVIRTQSSLIAGTMSVPEPDIAVLAGTEIDYVDHHPTTALLVVEVAVTTAAQDRFTKTQIYAGTCVDNYWIVHPSEEWIEVYRDVRPDERRYATMSRYARGSIIDLDAVPNVRVLADDLFPPRRA
jgi:Uma2 family endonuclease